MLDRDRPEFTRLLEARITAARRALSRLESGPWGRARGKLVLRALENMGAAEQMTRFARDRPGRQGPRAWQLMRQAIELIEPRDLEEYERVRRVLELMPRFYKRITGNGLPSDDAAERPSPAVDLLRARQGLEHQLIALEALGRGARALILKEQLAELDDTMRSSFVVLTSFEDLEPYRRKVLRSVYGHRTSRAEWWWTELRGFRYRDLIRAASEGLLHVDEALRDRIASDPRLWSSLCGIHERADFRNGQATHEAPAEQEKPLTLALALAGPLKADADAEPPDALGDLAPLESALALVQRLKPPGPQLASMDALAAAGEVHGAGLPGERKFERLKIELPRGWRAGISQQDDGVELELLGKGEARPEAHAFRLQQGVLEPAEMSELQRAERRLHLSVPWEPGQTVIVVFEVEGRAYPVFLHAGRSAADKVS